MRKPGGKDKDNIKVQNHPLTNMISKLASMKKGQMQNIENAFEIKRPATRNNSAHIHLEWISNDILLYSTGNYI